MSLNRLTTLAVTDSLRNRQERKKRIRDKVKGVGFYFSLGLVLGAMITGIVMSFFI